MIKFDYKNRFTFFLIILLGLFYFFYVYSGTSYIQNWDFYWRPSKHIGYSNIYKSYFFDFFNSFYLYDSEIGYDHSFWYFNQLNPYYALSFIFKDNGSYFIQLSNLISYIIGLSCLIKISNNLRLDFIKKILFVLTILTYLYYFAYSQNDPRFNDYFLLWIFVLFFIELNLNKKISYRFYIFFFIYSSLVCSYFFIFHTSLSVILYLIFFYKFKKDHLKNLFFFFITNFIIWLIVLGPAIFEPSPKIIKNINSLFSMNGIVDFMLKYDQFKLISEIRIGSDLFLYLPIGIIIYSILNLSNLRLFKIYFGSIIVVTLFIIFINSNFFSFLYTGNIRFFLNYYHIITILFIYFNLINLLNEKRNEILIYFLPLFLIFDLLFLSNFNINNLKLADQIYIFLLYFPFCLLFFKNFKQKNFFTFFILILFFIFKPFSDLNILKKMAKSKNTKHNIELYNDFISCFKENTPYQAHDRVLATGVHNTQRNFIDIQNMLTERERGTDINILYMYREIIDQELNKSYRLMLKDYKYFGLKKFPPAFLNKKTNEFRFSDNYFTEIGANIAIVFNDPEKKFTNFKSFKYTANCKNDLYEADIYTSIIPRGSATLKKNDGNEIKLISKNKNSWDISKLQYENSEFVLRFAKFTTTKILIDNKPVKFSYKDGKFIIPFSKGNEIEILYENFNHKMVFIATLLKYLILIILFLHFLMIFLRKLKSLKINI